MTPLRLLPAAFPVGSLLLVVLVVGVGCADHEHETARHQHALSEIVGDGGVLPSDEDAMPAFAVAAPDAGPSLPPNINDQPQLVPEDPGGLVLQKFADLAASRHLVELSVVSAEAEPDLVYGVRTRVTASMVSPNPTSTAAEQTIMFTVIGGTYDTLTVGGADSPIFEPGTSYLVLANNVNPFLLHAHYSTVARFLNSDTVLYLGRELPLSSLLALAGEEG